LTTRRLLVTARWVFAALAAVPLACAPESPPVGSKQLDPLALSHDAPQRVVAIGDLHGDLRAARAALRLAGAIDTLDRWIGGDLVLVQTGDILDRGDDELEVLGLLEKVSAEAEAEGGAVYVLNGNHELMNAYLDYRYVTDEGWTDFEDESGAIELDSVLASTDRGRRGRIAAVRPGGPVARRLAERNLFVIVGRTLFTHGGVLPEHVDMGLDPMNEAVRDWLRGEAEQPEWVRGDLSPVWNRLYSDEPTSDACDTLDRVLDRLGVDRMVVGHTIQDAGITAYCGGRVWCIDVGMAAHYGGRPEVLEIRGDVVRGLK